MHDGLNIAHYVEEYFRNQCLTHVLKTGYQSHRCGKTYLHYLSSYLK